MGSNVFYMNDRANSLPEAIMYKAVKVLRDAGLQDLFKKGDTVGIKLHMGEHGNVFNLRPQWISAIVDEIKRLGGKPVVVDCNTIIFSDYSSRAKTKDHLKNVARHGFTEEVLGCPIWICDGEYGFDDVKVEVPNGVMMKHSYMGKKLLELDAVVVATHFKGHPMGVFGGSLKNVGIGMGSKRGKLCTHFLNHPIYGRKAFLINQEAAAGLAQGESPTLMDRLINACAFDALEWKDGVLHYHSERCVQCAGCFGGGLFSGTLAPSAEALLTWAPTMVDAFAAYVNAIGKEKFIYLNYAMDISPWCDCCNWHDKSLVPNLGVFASKDPVAVDMACLEASEAAYGLPDSKATDFGFGEPGTERFTNCSSMAKVSQWAQINAGVFNGVGSSEYNLVESEPAPDTDFWPEPYSPKNIWGQVNREAIRKGNWTPEYPYYFDELQLSMTELSIKPKGKQKDMSIHDL